ncbi:hypothetical protein Trydic_g7352 [Trypoxylus dichotomus]
MIAKWWGKILDVSNQDDEDNLPLTVLQQKCKDVQAEALAETSDILHNFHYIVGGKNVTGSETLNWVHGDENLQPIEEPDIVKHEAAIRAFDTCLNSAEENNIPVVHILTLQRLKEEAFFLKQKKVQQ